MAYAWNREMTPMRTISLDRADILRAAGVVVVATRKREVPIRSDRRHLAAERQASPRSRQRMGRQGRVLQLELPPSHISFSVLRRLQLVFSGKSSSHLGDV